MGSARIARATFVTRVQVTPEEVVLQGRREKSVLNSTRRKGRRATHEAWLEVDETGAAAVD